MNTPPIGYNEEGQPIEEVVTTATRIRGFSIGAVLAVLGLAFLGYELAHELKLQPHLRRRALRARARPRRRR